MGSTKTLNKNPYIQQCWDAYHKYIDGVLSGSILTNENIKLAIKRHLSDIDRSDLDWRPEAVERVFKFFSYLRLPGKRFNLEPFQAFMLAGLFGLYYKNTNTRKYMYAFLFIGRKNGKTAFAAALQLYFMIADGVKFPFSVLVSGSQTQANDTSFLALRILIKSSPALSSRIAIMKSNRIVFKDPNKDGICKTVPAVEDRLEGLNPTSCILDEIHTYKSAQKFNVIKNALGTKENPMLFLISTAGYGKDSFCAQLVETGRNVLRNLSEDDRFFYMLYELEEGDDYMDPNVWIKSNPGLDTILDRKVIEGDAATSKSMPALLGDFVTKRFNIFLEELTEWIDDGVLMQSFNTLDPEVLKTLPCYVGIDLSSTRDLAALTCLWDAGEKFYSKTYYFFVKTTDNALRKGGIDIWRWCMQGYIIPCTTPTLDYDLVLEYIKKIHDENDVQGLFYDPWHFDRMKNEVVNLGLWSQPVAPTLKNFDPATRFLEMLFYEGRIVQEDNPCTRWNFRNTVLYKDTNGNMKPNKNKSKDSIDGVISTLNAIAGYLSQNTGATSNFLNNI